MEDITKRVLLVLDAIDKTKEGVESAKKNVESATSTMERHRRSISRINSERHKNIASVTAHKESILALTKEIEENSSMLKSGAISTEEFKKIAAKEIKTNEENIRSKKRLIEEIMLDNRAKTDGINKYRGYIEQKDRILKKSKSEVDASKEQHDATRKHLEELTRGTDIFKSVGMYMDREGNIRDRVTGTMMEQGVVTDILNKRQAEFSNLSKDTNVQVDKLHSVLDRVNISWDRNRGFIDKVTDNTLSYREVLRRTTDSTQQFKMHLLGAMFFGMALAGAMFGILQPALDTAGVFEIISTTLEIFFLPIALALLDVLLPIAMAFMGSPEWFKLLVGGIVFALGSLGLFMMAINQIRLGMNSLIPAITMVKNYLASLGPAVSKARTLMISPIAITGIALAAVAAYVAWKVGGDNIKSAWDGVMNGIRLATSGNMDAAKIEFKRAIDNISLFLEKFAVGAATIFVAIGHTITSVFIDAINWVIDKVNALDIFGIHFDNITKKFNTLEEAFIASGIPERLEEIRKREEELAEPSEYINNVMEENGLAVNNWKSAQEELNKTLEETANITSDIASNVEGVTKGGLLMRGGEAVRETVGFTTYEKNITVPKLQTGGFVKSGGIFELHAGEAVTPANKSNMGTTNINYSPTINMTNNITNDIDIDRIKRELSKGLVNDINSMLRR